MKLKDLYISNEARRYSAVKHIKKENLKLEMKPLTKIKNNIVLLLVILAVVIGMLLLQFNLRYFIVSLLLIAVLVLVFIFGNKSVLVCDKETLNIKQGVQNLNIPYKNLKNVYIGRVSGLLFFLPAFNYNIIVRYEDNFSFLRELEFSLLCADPNEVETFINNFEIEEQVEERFVQYEKRKFVRRLIGTIFTVILAAIIVIYLLSLGGINLAPLI